MTRPPAAPGGLSTGKTPGDPGEHVIDLTSERRARGDRSSAGEGGPDDRTHRVLHRVAYLLNSTLELNEVLHRLAQIVRDEVGADRCSLFLLEGGHLAPAVALGWETDQEAWEAFRQMEPVRLDALPGAWDQMRSFGAVPVEDARDHPLVPRAWASRFGLTSLVLVPLHAAAEPCGLMVVDYQGSRTFGEEELRFLESLAAYAGVAVRNARAYGDATRRATLQQALARGAAQLNRQTGARELAHVLVEAYADLIGARTCSIGLFDPAHTRITTLATTGAQGGPRAPIPLADVPAHIVQRLIDAWTTSPDPVLFEDESWFNGVASAETDVHLVIPLVIDEKPHGAVVLGSNVHDRLHPEERDAAETLAAMASSVLERTWLLGRLERHVARLEIMQGVSAALVEGADAAALMARLNELVGVRGIEVVSLTSRDTALAAYLQTDEPHPEERAVYSRDAEPTPLTDGSLAVPMQLGDTVVGSMRVRPASLDDDERAFALAIARGVAEVASRGALRTSLDHAERGRAVAAERDRVAAEMHDSVGQVLAAISLMARRALEQLPRESPWAAKFARVAELAVSGKWEIDQSVRALSFVPAEGRGLTSALRELTDAFMGDSGIETIVTVDGAPRPLDPAVERALYRVTHESLINAWRHARCGTVHVTLGYDEDEVSLVVRDDGVGFGRHSGARVAGIGISAMRRTLAQLGGTLRTGNASPRGARIEVRVDLSTSSRV